LQLAHFKWIWQLNARRCWSKAKADSMSLQSKEDLIEEVRIKNFRDAFVSDEHIAFLNEFESALKV
jgi:hypothetical protein